MFIPNLRTEARWSKAIQHLRESGELTNSPRDIGGLIKEIQRDTLDECDDIIKDMLMSYAVPKISRGIIAGFPEWYKEQLMKEQFGEENMTYKQVKSCDNK